MAANQEVSSLILDWAGAAAQMAAKVAGGAAQEHDHHLQRSSRTPPPVAPAEAAAAPPDEENKMMISTEVARPLAFRLAAASSTCDYATGASIRVYPPPLARHEEVVNDAALFMDTLCKFHDAMGSRMANPRMGGSQLDLFRLYQEVTMRGGLEQVMREKLWKDIKAVFNFPKTTTSASFVLRKYYISLLHHYEQVYFFRNQGPLVTPPVPVPPASSPVLLSPEHCSVAEDSSPKQHKLRKGSPAMELNELDVGAAIGQTVTCSIEEKFEHGYLVTVVIGSDKFRGVIYQVPTMGGSSGSNLQQQCTSLIPMGPPASRMHARAEEGGGAAGGGVRLRRKRRKLGLRRRDPNAPKLNRSGYNFFFAEQRAKLKLVHSDKDREISKMIGEAWSSMTEEQKLPYQERGAIDRERYRREIKEYKERQQQQQQSSLDLQTGEQQHNQQQIQQQQQQKQQIEQQELQQQQLQQCQLKLGSGNDHDDNFHVSFNKPDIGLGASPSLHQQQVL